MKSNGNNCFSITTQRSCTPEGAGEFTSELNEILKLRSQSDIELPIKDWKTEVRIFGYNN